jgi:hypothetical protein
MSLSPCRQAGVLVLILDLEVPSLATALASLAVLADTPPDALTTALAGALSGAFSTLQGSGGGGGAIGGGAVSGGGAVV